MIDKLNLIFKAIEWLNLEFSKENIPVSYKKDLLMCASYLIDQTMPSSLLVMNNIKSRLEKGESQLQAILNEKWGIVLASSSVKRINKQFSIQSFPEGQQTLIKLIIKVLDGNIADEAKTIDNIKRLSDGFIDLTI